MSQPPRLLCDDAARDDLCNLRAGLYGEPAPESLFPRFTLTGGQADAAVAAGSVELVDAEGAPLCTVRVASGPGGEIRTGALLAWGPPPPPRPWQSLHLGEPVTLDPATTLVVSGTAIPRHLAAGTETVLVFASTGLDSHTVGNRVVREAVLAASVASARVIVVPVGGAGPAREERIRRVLHVLGLGSSTRRSDDRASARGEGGVVAMFTGLSGSGKSTLARAVSTRLIEEGRAVTLLDGDRVRHHLTAGLGFSPEDRDTNVRRIGWVAAEIAHHGGIAICSPIAPYDHVRQEVKAMAEDRGARFVLIHVSTPVEECERRDRKGLYAKARRGELPDFTGISAPYETPATPDLRVDTTGRDVDELRDRTLGVILPNAAPEWSI